MAFRARLPANSDRVSSLHGALGAVTALSHEQYGVHGSLWARCHDGLWAVWLLYRQTRTDVALAAQRGHSPRVVRGSWSDRTPRRSPLLSRQEDPGDGCHDASPFA